MLWRSSATSGVIGSDEGWEHDDDDDDDDDDAEVVDGCDVDTLDGEDGAADAVVVDVVVVVGVVGAEVEVAAVEEEGSGSLCKMLRNVAKIEAVLYPHN